MNAPCIFIIGGASGLGVAIVDRYMCVGYCVVIGDLIDEDFGFDVLWFRCDVCSEDDLRVVVDVLTTCWGGVDIVVNNVGVVQAGVIEDVSLEDW